MKNFSRLLAILGIAICAVSCCCSEPSIEDKVENILSQMTLQEKIDIIHAQSKFSSPGVPRLGVPELWTDDGPHGVRPEVLWDEWAAAGWTSDYCCAYPVLTCLAASWDEALAREYGVSVGEEARYRKKNVLLGPGVNICRTPLCGRNFEYMGEDPYLAGKMAAKYVQGVQSNKVAVCVKHFALNDQEFKRSGINVNVDDRTLYEIYLPAFKRAVQEGGAWSVMCSYNRYQGEYAAHNPRLLKTILKEEWDWDGAVVSDWGATHDTFGAATGGLDLEFGSHTNGVDKNASNAYDRYFLAADYKKAIEEGKLPEEELDDKVRRALRLNFRTQLDGNFGSFASPEHFATSRHIGTQGIVLLKNDGDILPMKADAKKIVVLGENAIRPMVVGGQSSSLKTKYEITPLEGIKNAFPDAEVVYERTYKGTDPTPGWYNYSFYDLSDPRSSEELLARALAAVKDADYVLFMGGLNKSQRQDCEGDDRQEYTLPYGQNEVIEAIAAVRPDLVYVNFSGSPVAMPFADKVGAIVQGWYLGSETGNALADVLTGKVNPSGKLPFTFPYALADGPVKTERQYPGVKDENGMWQVYYDEGIYVGYRWYDTNGIAAQWPFGYGLSYTTFEYGAVKASSSRMRSKIRVSVPVTNTGKVAGAEIVQLYVSDPECSVDRPAKELKGFRKLFLEPGETAVAQFELTPEDLAWFDAESHSWKTEAGKYVALIGASVSDIKGAVEFSL